MQVICNKDEKRVKKTIKFDNKKNVLYNNKYRIKNK